MSVGLTLLVAGIAEERKKEDGGAGARSELLYPRGAQGPCQQQTPLATASGASRASGGTIVLTATLLLAEVGPSTADERRLAAVGCLEVKASPEVAEPLFRSRRRR